MHLCEADWDDAPQIPIDFRKDLRANFKNTIIATGNKEPEEGEILLQNNMVDMIGFGRKFLTNPDYPERVNKMHLSTKSQITIRCSAEVTREVIPITPLWSNS
ncbi:oxidoreductase [Chryseobacterium ginsenosidimutans]|uniref:oxidoreductase n=1 Tax=Chryseobacterium ginsenosidimutans TaxID=687846 RepID=UPI0035B67E97